ncbi:MAG: recombination regulator RecX [Motiliproteus sp.]|nr:recombination regulator RecX [Motiliproteus sp.]MCW9054233.1 recombination regulator RecX [Motiliproteus sp.]
MNSRESELLNRAYGLLARREHSRRELRQKLQSSADSEEQLESLLEQLQAQGLQSDQRYAESFVRSRIGRGQGERRIRQELKQRGVDSENISLAFTEADADWFELALEMRRKRFGCLPPEDVKARAKQIRFLLYRGFNQEQINYALDYVEPET